MEPGTRWNLPTGDDHGSKTAAVISGADSLSELNDSAVEHSASFAAGDGKHNDDDSENLLLTTQEKLRLSSWGLPEPILERYASRGIVSMFPWQLRCLQQGSVLAGRNLVYSAPTSAGKTLVAEILAIKTVLERRKKVIIVLPFVSVVREKMHYFQHLLGSSGVRVAGLMGSQALPGGFSRVHMAVCTIEKANSLVNRLLEEGALGSLGALVVDELHLIGDPFRGYLLELLLAKVKFVAERQGLDIQIIGMSATLPNLDELARWLDAELFTTDYRPVPLKEFFKCGDSVYDRDLRLLYRIKPQIQINNDPDHVIHLCLETVTNGHSALIFCPTKTWCESLATSLATHIRTLGCGSGPLSAALREQLSAPPLTELLEQLRGSAAGLDAVLGRCVQYGVAFHHAGLTMDEREILETGFRGNVLRLLVATSTLSSGVNLPARRVIVRTVMFHGRPLEAAAYHQMAGRAGRKGCDTQGESFLLFKTNEMAELRRAVVAQPAAVRSCLEPPAAGAAAGLAPSMKRALLEVIAGGVANTMDELSHFVSCTLMGSMGGAKLASEVEPESQEAVPSSQEEGPGSAKWPLDAYVGFLLRSELIRRQQAGEGEAKHTRLVSTALGSACLASALHPDEALALFRELQRARQSFVLENDLHIVYLVTPYSVASQLGNLDWIQVVRLWRRLPADMKRVGALVGVREAVLTAGAAGALPRDGADLALTRRFHTALALNELLEEAPLARVAAEFGCSRGLLQALQQGAATYAGVVRAFCSRLRWHALERLVEEFAPRLELGVSRDLLPLARLQLLDAPRARALHDRGLVSPAALANAAVADVETALFAARPFDSRQGVAGECDYDAERRQRRRLVCLTGRAGMTERQAAELLIASAQQLVQRDLEMAMEGFQSAIRPPSSPEASVVSISELSAVESLPIAAIGIRVEHGPGIRKHATSTITSAVKESRSTTTGCQVPVASSQAVTETSRLNASNNPEPQCEPSNLKNTSSKVNLLSVVNNESNALTNNGQNKRPVISSPSKTDSEDFAIEAPVTLSDVQAISPPVVGRFSIESSDSDASIENTPQITRTSRRMEKIMQYRSTASIKYATIILPTQEEANSPEFANESRSELLPVEHSMVNGDECEQTSSGRKVCLVEDVMNEKAVDCGEADYDMGGNYLSGPSAKKNNEISLKPLQCSVGKTSGPAKQSLNAKPAECGIKNSDFLQFIVHKATASHRFQSPAGSENRSGKDGAKTDPAPHFACSTPESAATSCHPPDAGRPTTDMFSSPLELPNLTTMLRLENERGTSGNLSARSRVSLDMFDSPSPLPPARPGLVNELPFAGENRVGASPSFPIERVNRGVESPLMRANAACRLSVGSRNSSLFGDSLILESQFDRAIADVNGANASQPCDTDCVNECDGSQRDSNFRKGSSSQLNTEPVIEDLDILHFNGGSGGLDCDKQQAKANISNNLENTSSNGNILLQNSQLKINSPAQIILQNSHLKINSPAEIMDQHFYQNLELDTQLNLVLNAINKNDKSESDQNAAICDKKEIFKIYSPLAKKPKGVGAENVNIAHSTSPCNISNFNDKKSSSLNFEESLNIDTQLNFVLNSEESYKNFKSPPRKSKYVVKAVKDANLNIQSNNILPKSLSINFEESLTVDTQLNFVLNSENGFKYLKSTPNILQNTEPIIKVKSINDLPTSPSLVSNAMQDDSFPEMFGDSLCIDTQMALAIDGCNKTSSRRLQQSTSSRLPTNESVKNSSRNPAQHLVDRKWSASKATVFKNNSFKSPLPNNHTFQNIVNQPQPTSTKVITEMSTNVSNHVKATDSLNSTTFFEDSTVTDELEMNVNTRALDDTSSLAQDIGSASQNNSLEDVVLCTPPTSPSFSRSLLPRGKRKTKRKRSPEASTSSKKIKHTNEHRIEESFVASGKPLSSNGQSNSVGGVGQQGFDVKLSATESIASRGEPRAAAGSVSAGKESGKPATVPYVRDRVRRLGSKRKGVSGETKKAYSPWKSAVRQVFNEGPLGETENLVSAALTVRWCTGADLEGSWRRLEEALEAGGPVALALGSQPVATKAGPLIGSAILGRRSTPNETPAQTDETVVTGFALSFGGLEAFYVPLEQGSTKGDSDCLGLRLLRSLRSLHMYNAQAQMTMLLRWRGIHLDARLFDPVVADWLVDSSRCDHGLLPAMQRESEAPVDLLRLLARLPRADAKPARHPRPLRAALEAVCVWHLAKLRKDRLADLPPGVVEVEMSVLAILAASDCTGLHVDCAGKSDLRRRIGEAISQHPALERQCRIMLASLDSLGLSASVHPRSDPLGATGRATTRSPNIQCMPRDIALQSQSPLSLRSLFVAPPGEVLVAGDFCQLELRLLAHLSGDSLLREAVTAEGDAFAQLASAWFRIPAFEVTMGQRASAKAACYGLIYGMGSRALADKLDVDLPQAEEVLREFAAAFPDAAAFVEDTKQRCRETGYVTTLCGRRRYLPAISSRNSEERSGAERQAVNSTIQGSAADVFKRAMVNVTSLAPPGAKLVLHLHDELMYQVSADRVAQTAEALKRGMSQAVALSVPLPIKVTAGASWGGLQEL